MSMNFLFGLTPDGETNVARNRNSDNKLILGRQQERLEKRAVNILALVRSSVMSGFDVRLVDFQMTCSELKI